MVAITQEVVSVLYVGLASPILSNDMDVLGGPRCRKVVPLVYCNDLLVNALNTGIYDILMVAAFVRCHGISADVKPRN